MSSTSLHTASTTDVAGASTATVELDPIHVGSILQESHARVRLPVLDSLIDHCKYSKTRVIRYIHSSNAERHPVIALGGFNDVSHSDEKEERLSDNCGANLICTPTFDSFLCDAPFFGRVYQLK